MHRILSSVRLAGPQLKALIAFAVPYLTANILQSLNGSINSIWIGHFLGEAAFAATTNINSVLFFLLSLMFGLTMASSILVGQYLGANRLEDAKKVVGTSVLFVLAFSLTLSILGYTLAPRILNVMHVPPEAVRPALSYLRIILVAFPPFALLMLSMSLLRSGVDARTPMLFMGLAVALDIVLNPLFIFGWGPLPGFGVAGSAFATLTAQCVSLSALLAFLYRRQHPLVIRRGDARYLKIDRTVLKVLITSGLPMGMQMLVLASSGLVIISLINQFGAEATAAAGAVLQLWTYAQMPAAAVAGAVTVICAINIGAKRWDRVASATTAGIILSVLATGLLVVGILYFNRTLLGVFLPKDGGAIALATHANSVVVWSVLFASVPFVLFAVVSSTGAALGPLLILMISLWLVRWGVAIGLEPRLGSDAVWWSFPAGAFVLLLLSVVHHWTAHWRETMIVRPAAHATTDSLSRSPGA